MPHSSKREGPDQSWGWARNLPAARAERVLSVALTMIAEGASHEDVARELNSRLDRVTLESIAAWDMDEIRSNRLWTAKRVRDLLARAGHR